MSTQETLFRHDGRAPLRIRLAARLAVAIALGLSRLPPRRIRAVLVAVRGRARPAAHDQVLAARRAVVASSVTCAGKGCLPRSIATALLVRMRGQWPSWRVGARTAPFGAHAWVEAEGRPVGEDANITSFRPLLSVDPRDPA
ncbi:lasso peptide biosynthesis B2 protein [Saccharopolyspora gloriosae]|uniref:lasso peptide biosynthesis B2 protein n=1 Tax=Saccharopolyspora gloriosae TaxID=455344 RepID=UPI001FB82FCE|nr:lasso peptide biosynthesis B2 protein [Saccharopolyspora gloriosae]